MVLIAREPPNVEYFSFTSFALWVPRKGLQFSSLADSVNQLPLGLRLRCTYIDIHRYNVCIVISYLICDK